MNWVTRLLNEQIYYGEAVTSRDETTKDGKTIVTVDNRWAELLHEQAEQRRAYLRDNQPRVYEIAKEVCSHGMLGNPPCEEHLLAAAEKYLTRTLWP